MMRIVPIDHLKTKKSLGSSQDGSREFISLLATICADGSALPPGLIYQGDSHDLQDSWLEEFDSSVDSAYFAVSKKGWTNEDLGLSWLSKILEPNTAEKAGNGRRLLIVDGHSSHVNMKFIDFCDKHNIILVVFPPHSTHRLQPLDVGIFSPLATAYSNQINQIIQSSSGFTRITKRSFWSIFREAWKKSLTPENICSSFAATGIYPFQPEKVLYQLKEKTPSPISSDDEAKKKTPRSVRGLRRTIKAMRAEPSDVKADLDLMIRASEKLAIRNDLQEHEIRGLRAALVDEKKRRKRGKNMGLFPKDEPGQAMFYSPNKIATVREHQANLEAQKEQEKLDKEMRRQDKAAEKERKAQEIRDRRDQKERLRAEKVEQKQRDIQARAEQKQLNQQLQIEEQVQKKDKKQASVLKGRKQEDLSQIKADPPETRVSRSGRSITRPTHL